MCRHITLGAHLICFPLLVIAESIGEIPEKQRIAFSKLINEIDGYECKNATHGTFFGQNHNGKYWVVTCNNGALNRKQYLINYNSDILISEISWRNDQE